ncbi:MAG: FmdB family transcriptional regulator [Acidimicrobiales bacterium]|nr:FmdB family transcriptional regulator [Acidimicrobiales bacterium]
MPVYEYKCVECLERFEVEQSMSDKTLTQIKGDNHTHKVKKVFSPVGISFKGSGFYKNDSAKKSPKSTSSAENGSAKNGSSTASTSSTTTEKKSSTETSSTKASTNSD